MIATLTIRFGREIERKNRSVRLPQAGNAVLCNLLSQSTLFAFSHKAQLAIIKLPQQSWYTSIETVASEAESKSFSGLIWLDCRRRSKNLPHH